MVKKFFKIKDNHSRKTAIILFCLTLFVQLLLYIPGAIRTEPSGFVYTPFLWISGTFDNNGTSVSSGITTTAPFGGEADLWIWKDKPLNGEGLSDSAKNVRRSFVTLFSLVTITIFFVLVSLGLIILKLHIYLLISLIFALVFYYSTIIVFFVYTLKVFAEAYSIKKNVGGGFILWIIALVLLVLSIIESILFALYTRKKEKENIAATEKIMVTTGHL